MLPFTSNPADNTNANSIQTMRLREDPPPITPATRTSRKRKSPPSNANNPIETQSIPQQQQPPPPPQQPPMHHALPPMIVHPMPGGPLPPGYHYADFTPGGMPPPNPQQPPDQQSPSSANSSGRTLSNSKRAEQNRKAQRAFRERRDQHVKALESRSQLLDAALASADEANRRWEECRTLVDQLRVENAALRAALSQAQLLPPGIGAPPASLPQQQQQAPQSSVNGGLQASSNGAHLEEARTLEAVVNELKSDSTEASQEKKTE